MRALRIILQDHLSSSISSLENCDKENDIILICELDEYFSYIKHHKKKIAFLLSAMRHFAQELIEDGYQVIYKRIDDPENSGILKQEVEKLLSEHNIEQVIITHPSEYYILADLQSWQMPLTILDDNRFLADIDSFKNWAQGKKQLRMEFFYREMRKKYNILMGNNEPLGGKWNYDFENRKPPKEGLKIPLPYNNHKDEISAEVMNLVSEKFKDNFGDVEPFYFAVTRDQALEALELFIKERLSDFGDYQDAMIENEPWMYHSHISFYLNCGLLLPLEAIEAAEDAYHRGEAELPAVEGFIRQILGWREYVRGIYWLKMPEYQNENFLEAKRDLPEFYWTGDTKMNCLKQSILETKKNAYAHHIQRLMVLGNFALLIGVDPLQLNEWFHIVYADAYEWVEMPNVSGMVLFADGGYLASKPYAAGGSYINKMSNYCKNCHYKVSEKEGESACPFNYLYWNFLIKNQGKLSSNQRLRMIYSTLAKMSDQKKQAIISDSKKFFQ